MLWLLVVEGSASLEGHVSQRAVRMTMVRIEPISVVVAKTTGEDFDCVAAR